MSQSELFGSWRARRYEDLGVARLLVPVPALAMGGNPLDGMSRFADEMLVKLA